MSSRRGFLKKGVLSTSVLAGGFGGCTTSSSRNQQDSLIDKYALLDQTVGKSILKKDLFSTPLIIETMELLRYKGNFICRVRTNDGAEGISVGNNMQLISLYLIFVNRLQPFFYWKGCKRSGNPSGGSLCL